MISDKPLLEVANLRVSLNRGLDVVRGVSFSVHAKKVVAIVGESGSGKSMTVRAVMGLPPPLASLAGSVRLNGEELVGASERRLRRLRGWKIGMIFQDPMTALNPVIRVGDLIAEAVRLHNPRMSARQAMHRAVELLETVAVPQPDVRIRQYSHEFSGGMRQRVMIAMAIANNPDVLIADEPTTALDVTVQAQIIEVLGNLRQMFPVGLVLITHDLGVVAGVADTVVVMYAGKVVETGPVRAIFHGSRHPYTRGLLSCLPSIEQKAGKLVPIPGNPPSLSARPSGCPFRPRCPMARDICSAEEPELRTVHGVETACHFAEDIRTFDARAFETMAGSA